ncbi:MAG TPA: TauD/TfdA family dioxygenase [Steroidobacteraceae bacterium]|nr:TauD/TfdA family dioxygenase [Steroidobacteraceae bacterium]
MALEKVDLTPRIGTEVRADLATLLSGQVSRELRELLVERGVVVVRGVEMRDADQRAFTQTLGKLRLGTVKAEGEAGLMKVTHDRKENPVYAEFFPGTFLWHFDGPYEEVPPFATVLTPRVLSPTGGNTEFANMYAAYEDLPGGEKAFLDTLQVVHTMQSAMWHSYEDVTVEQLALWRTYPVRTQSLVWRHRSGRRSLVLAASASRILGMHLAESFDLLQRLMAWATRPEYVYRHEWRMNDLLIWDNTGTMHRAKPYDMSCGRRLHRFTLDGEEPIRGAETLAIGRKEGE